MKCSSLPRRVVLENDDLRFSAADVLWGNALRWVTGFGMVEATPVIADYIERVTSRPAEQRAVKANEALAAGMGLAG